MTLGFTTKIKNKPTYFVEKIWQSLLSKNVSMNMKEFIEIANKCKAIKEYVVGSKPAKIHTIRADPKNRWKVGNKIHFVIGNRTKNRFQFAPIINVVSIQSFKIEWKRSIDMKNRWLKITIDGKEISGQQIVDLVQNDGFDTYTDFCNYFKEDFEGKIIHWTNFKY